MRFDSSGNVQVYIHVESTSDDTLQQLRNLGANAEIVNSDSNVVQARVAPSALDEMAALNAVQEIGPPIAEWPRSARSTPRATASTVPTSSAPSAA